jgi:DNA primase
MAQRITDRILEEVRHRVDIVELIGSRGITLKRAGTSFKACCPFHHEKTPSFHVNPARQTYHCFGCQAHGDVFKFLMQQDGLQFIDAVRMLAEKTGVQLTTETDFAAEARNTLYALHAELAAFYTRCLHQIPAAAAARAYLERRKLPAEIVDRFGIGYAPEGRDTLQLWAAKHEISTELLVTAGLLSPSNDPRRPDDYYDRFRGRLMFPIRDAQGRVVAFSGRILDPAAHPAKYVNSPETPIFIKSRVLYALDQARSSIVKHPRREALVCEGQIDVIRCHASGFDTAVASQGTAFTREHVELLKRYADSVVLVFDGDAAGRKAALRTGALFLEVGLPVRVAALPPGEDPDSLLRDKGPQVFRDALESAASLTAFQVRVLREAEATPDSVDAVNRTAKAVLETLAGCSQGVLRAHLLQEAATLLHLPCAALEEDLERLRATAARNAERHAAAPVAPSSFAPAEAAAETTGLDAETAGSPAALPGVSLAETSLCELLIHHEDDAHVPDLLEALLPLDLVPHPFARRVLEAARAARRTGTDRLAELAADPDPAFRTFFDRLVCMHSRVETSRDLKPLDAARDLVVRLWVDALKLERGTTVTDGDRAGESRRLEIACLVRRLQGAPAWPARETLIRAELARTGQTPPPLAPLEPDAVAAPPPATPAASPQPPPQPESTEEIPDADEQLF